MANKLSEAQRRTLRKVQASGEDGYSASGLDARMIALWEMDLIHFYAPESIWLLAEAGRLALQEAGQSQGPTKPEPPL